jgi:hypothetical protein
VSTESHDQHSIHINIVYTLNESDF